MEEGRGVAPLQQATVHGAERRAGRRSRVYPGFIRHLDGMDELTMTATEPALCTSAPMIGFRKPAIARMIAAKFRSSNNKGVVVCKGWCDMKSHNVLF
jgi:hypothetical protein